MPRSIQALLRPWSRALTALVVFGVVLAGCGGGTDAAETVAEEEDRYQMGAPIDDSTYALIIESEYNGDTLTMADFQAYILNLMQQAGAIMDEAQRRRVRQGVAEEFIRRHLLLGEAERLGLEADSARIEEQIDQIAIQNRFPNRAALEEALAGQGMTLDSLRSFLKTDLPLQMLQEQMAEAATEPSAQELEAFRREQAEEVWAQHILFQVPDPAQQAGVTEKAEAVLDSVKSGSDFDEMARRHSQGPSAPQGGELGYFGRRDMVAPFSDAAFALSDSGDVAPELVETQFGYHIIRLLGRRLGALMDSTQAQALMMRDRQREAFEEGYRQLSQKAIIRVNPIVIDADLNAGGEG